jgi:hypothetical protein
MIKMMVMIMMARGGIHEVMMVIMIMTMVVMMMMVIAKMLMTMTVSLMSSFRFFKVRCGSHGPVV